MPDELPNKPVTIKDIANYLGIGHRSVSQALSNRESTTKVSERTRRRVREAAHKLGYRPHRAARALRTGKSGMIGVIVFGYLQQMNNQHLHCLLQEISRAGYMPFAQVLDSSNDRAVGDIFQTLLDVRCEGIIMLRPNVHLEKETLGLLHKADLPTVTIGGQLMDSWQSYLPDKVHDFCALAAHVLDCNCRTPTFVGVPWDFHKGGLAADFHIRAVVKGFFKGVQKTRPQRTPVKGRVYRMSQKQILASRLEGGPVHRVHAPGYLAMLDLLDRKVRPDAVLFRGDIWAHGALRACAERGVSVPDEIVITGYDDDPVSSVGSIPLTTVALDHEGISRLAVAGLVNQIKNSGAVAGPPVTLPGRLVVRASSVGHSNEGRGT